MKHQQTIKAAALLAASLSLAALALPAGAVVTVAYVQPENFRDLPFSPIDRERVLRDLAEHVATLEKFLPPGQDVKIEVLDLDMAGRLVPNYRASQDLRVLRGGADWPHMTVRYTLLDHGQVLLSGQDELSDMSYLDRINIYSDGDSLRFEKRMVDDWFKKKFAASH